MAGGWLRDAQADLAVQKILDGAARAFVDLGVSGAGMREIAKYAGCSRGTLYRYFDSRHALHLAFVEDRALGIVAALRVELDGVRDPAARLLEYILGAVQKVRADPAMTAWFEPGEAGMAARMSRGSEVIDRLSGSFVSHLVADGSDASDGRLRARWMVRVIVSLLTTPGESDQEERAFVSRFVVPSMLADAGTRPARAGARHR